MNEVVALRSITKSYNGRLVVKVDELKVGRGEVLAISGPNGAGKSTLIRLIGLLEPADSGTLEIFGRRPVGRQRAALRRRLAIVFQEPFMYRRSVYDNIAMGLRWRGLSAADIERRVKDVTELLRFDDLNRPARELSRGQAQRVALARALVIEPELLLLDEPLSALDRDTRAHLLENLADWLGGNGRSTVYVTHSRTEATKLATRVILMKEGQVAV